MFNTLVAASFNLVGDYTKNVLADGSLPKVAIHAMVGGLLAEATGGDFKTGALAAAASEALVGHLDTLVKGNDTLLTMSSQIVGVLAAAAQSDTDASCIQDATRKFQELSLQQDIDAIVSCQADPSSCAASSKEVANTMANLNAIRDIADYASPDAREAVQSLINGNYEFQEMLATATTEHSVGAMVESLKSKWALSDAQAQDIADNLKIALAVGVGTAAGGPKDLKTNLSEIWTLKPTQRGVDIESYLAKTEYSPQSGWYNVGAERNGYFPLVDFQNGNTLVSLKSVDTAGSTWLGRMQDHIIDLGKNGAKVDGVPANMVLDLRVQPGGSAAAKSLIEFGREYNVKVVVKEFK
ncbi:DUF637 domain-containing protein [Pseudomonas extremorientalis]|nr:DUF637 domain-containing protein [Pseudomonas extremorientalis]